MLGIALYFSLRSLSIINSEAFLNICGIFHQHSSTLILNSIFQFMSYGFQSFLTVLLIDRRPLELVLHDDAHVTIIEMEEGDEEPEIWLALGGEDRSLYHCLLTSENASVLSHTHTMLRVCIEQI